MKIVPTHKSDLDACINLSVASDEEVEKKISELLEWIQDINWPVAPLICERLKDIGAPLIEPVRNILSGGDDVWKYWVISNLLEVASKETVCQLRSELENIAKNPTESEKAEEVNIVASEVLVKCQ
jgi:hypothetical protein